MSINRHKDSDKQQIKNTDHTLEKSDEQLLTRKKMGEVVVLAPAFNPRTQEVQVGAFLLWNNLFVHYE